MISNQETEIHNEIRKERVILAGLADNNVRGSVEETTRSVEELGLLAETAGAEVAGTVVQQRSGIDSRTYLGKGKLQEIADACRELDADTVIFDDELQGSQIRNIEEITGLKVIDRTFLILDIFAQRAKSREGKLQVELAQQQYRYSRLTGLGKSLSRLGGGIGTRGPGETKLETDRRHINRRINLLKKQIEKIGDRRQRIRTKRSDADIAVIAVVGYTNAGKSTLINRICKSNLYAEDKLFATLDPAAKSVILPEGSKAVFVDTVGFIRKLPHNLIEAFKSTLEELEDADIIMHVMDSSDIDWQRHQKIVEDLLEDFNCASKPRITVFNKTDINKDNDFSCNVKEPSFNEKEGNVVKVSALTGYGIDNLTKTINNRIVEMQTKIKIVLPYDKAHLLDYIRKNGSIKSVEYKDDGIHAAVYLNESKLYPVTGYIIGKS